MEKKFGRLEKVHIRELWNGEASDFTPWLAQEDNIAELGEVLGIDLEVQEQECGVGIFRADILCKDLISDHFVLIENQLERTDHSHLGQLITYAAGLEAVTIIWIARTFADEHRAAIDWLNRVTDESVNFFGIEVEAYKIGNSLPAPNFNIVAKPNDWVRSARNSASSLKITDARQLQLEYWEAMQRHFKDYGTFMRQQKPYPQNFTNFSLGRSNFILVATCVLRDKRIRIDMSIREGESRVIYHRMQTLYEEDSRKHLGNDLIWKESPGAVYSSITLETEADVSNRDLWKDQHEWFRENLEKFDNYFRPKIKEFKG